MLDRDAIGVGTHFEPRTRHLTIGEGAEQLEHFALEFWLFVGDVGNYVAEYVPRRHTGVSRS